MDDLLIIGAGPIGIACGIEAKKNNLKYTIIDKGCLVNALYNYPLNMTFFSTSDRLEIGEIPFISNNSKPTRLEALEYYRRVCSHWKLNIKLYEKVISITKEKNFKIITDKTTYKTKNIVIATGFYDIPFLLNVPGENLEKVYHYYSEPHPFYGMNIAIVGSANSAVDAALETYRKGAKSVTMIIRENEIGDNVKYWVRPDIINRIKEGSIPAFFNSKIIEIKKESIIIKTNNKNKELKNDFVLAMTGYQPNFKLLDEIGVSFEKDKYRTPRYNSKTMESNIKGAYLAGVVCGGYKTNKWFIENSREHAPLIIKSIKKNK